MSAFSPTMMQDEPKWLTPAHVEALITEAGRDAVFARARELGWSASVSPPLWAWQQIALEVKATRRP